MNPILPADIAAKVNIGQATFGKFPENLLGSRARYIRAFKVRPKPPS